jgi:hypothetical protein
MTEAAVDWIRREGWAAWYRPTRWSVFQLGISGDWIAFPQSDTLLGRCFPTWREAMDFADREARR